MDDRIDDDVDCQDLVEWTTDYFEGALEPDQKRRLEHHLTECDGCTEYLAQMRALQGALGKSAATALPEAARERLLTTFRTWREEQR
jgi:anti-sigma factor RsiW